MVLFKGSRLFHAYFSFVLPVCLVQILRRQIITSPET